MRLVFAMLVLLLTACAGGGTDESPGAAPRPGKLELVGGVVADEAFDGAVEFGRVTIGERRARMVVVRNAGDLPVVLEPARVATPFGTDLAAPVELGAGAELQIAFTAEFTDDGPAEAAVRIASSGGRFDLRLHAEAVRCRVAVDETPLDFGAVRAGERWTLGVAVENVGEGVCTIESATSTDPAFLVDDVRTTIVPGVRANVNVHFRPEEADTTSSGELHLVVSGASFVVPLSGSALESCVRLDIAAVDFGVRSTCEPSTQRNLPVHNDCDLPLELLRLGVEQTDGSFFVGMADGFTLPPLGTSELIVAASVFTPGVRTGTVRVQWEGGPEFAIPVRIEATSGAFEQVDEFLPAPPSKPADVLVVVDDTAAMAPFRAHYEAFAASIIERLGGHDFHVGVTTVSSVTAPGCAQAPAGRLLPLDGSGPRVIDRDTPDPVGVLAHNLAAAPACQRASDASGTSAAWRALTELASLDDDPQHSLPADGNRGFLRAGSYLQVLFVSMSNDTTREPLTTWRERFASLRLTTTQLEDVMILSWTDTRGGCGGAGGSFYADLAWGLNGGDSSICSTDWTAPWTLPVAPVPAVFYLATLPTDLNHDGEITEEAGEISVTIDGERVPATSADGLPVWTFYREVPSVRFYDAFRPRGGEHVAVSYGIGCDFF